MSYSIFASKKTWASSTSKELHRVEAANDQELNQKANGLLKEGYDINGILPDISKRTDVIMPYENEAPLSRVNRRRR